MRRTSETAVCDRGWLERLGDRVVSAAGGMSAFDVGNTDQRQHQQRLQKTTSWVGYSPPPAWQMQMKKGFWNVCGLSLWKYGVLKKGRAIIQQLIRANLTPMCRFIKRCNYSWYRGWAHQKMRRHTTTLFICSAHFGSWPKSVVCYTSHSATGDVAARPGQYTQRCTKEEPTSSNPALNHLWCPTRGP